MEELAQRLILYIQDSCQKYKINDKIQNNITKQQNTQNYVDRYWSINIDEINEIKKNYKVINVDWLDYDKVNYAMFTDDYFRSNQDKEAIVNEMLDYYLSNKDKKIYKKTDYLCNRKEKICICNIHAHDFRKIYDGINYKPNENYISWIKKSNKPF
jgi:hypothetical protein